MIDCCRTTLNFLRKSFYDLNTVVKKWSARRKRNLVGSLFAQSSCVLRLNRPSRVGTASNLCSVMLDDVAPSPHMPEHEQYIFLRSTRSVRSNQVRPDSGGYKVPGWEHCHLSYDTSRPFAASHSTESHSFLSTHHGSDLRGLGITTIGNDVFRGCSSVTEL